MKPEEVAPWLERFVTVGLQDGSTWEVTLKATPQDDEYVMQPPGAATAEVPPHVQARDIIYLATMGEFSPELEERPDPAVFPAPISPPKR